jgi:protein-disulfide isomerase
MNLHLRSAIVFFVNLTFCSGVFSADASSLKLPVGAKVAVVIFEDLECPTCARAYPVVRETAEKQHVPVVPHDFPLPNHAWSLEAAVYARYFDSKSAKLGDDFRRFIYKSQLQVTGQKLRAFVNKFADDNKIPVPFEVDPSGELAAKVQADYALGQSIGLDHVPTIFVIGKGNRTTLFVEVADLDQLSKTIEDMQKKVASVTPGRRP